MTVGRAHCLNRRAGAQQRETQLPPKDGVTVVVDPKSMLLLDGTELDFETGIRGHGFRFNNPNVKDNCGCGESISF